MFFKLESLRGLAACAVVLYHSPFNVNDAVLGLFRNAYLFVDLFFVLSGFVMAHAYADKIAAGMRFSDYMALRLGRIYPLHLVMLLVWVPYVLIKVWLFHRGFGGTDPSEESNAYTFVTNLFLVHSWHLHDDLSWNFPSWSISAEFAVYMLFFGWVFWLDRRQSLWMPLLVSMGAYGVLYAINPLTLDFTQDFGVIRCAAAFFLGMAIHRLRSVVGPTLPGLPLWELASMVLIGFSVSLAHEQPWALHGSIVGFALAVLVMSDQKDGPIGRLLLSAPLRKLGLWSYSIYMVNGIIMGGSINVLQHLLHLDTSHGLGWLAIAINTAILAVVVALAHPCYLWIECRGRDAVKGWLRQRGRPV